MDVGLLILRLVVGLTLAAHGAQKLFGAFGGHGVVGTGGFLESLGFRPGVRHARLAGATEFGAGLLLALGLLTPLAAAGFVGVLFVASVSVHAKNGFFGTSGGFEYPFVLAVAGWVTAFTGAGAYSIDHALGLRLGGIGWGIGSALVGLGMGAFVLGGRHVEPAEPAPAPAPPEPARDEQPRRTGG
jgi:putative oxidoreductase